jgi:HPt (histidine-containing phosphotransfer) domain-containing protein
MLPILDVNILHNFRSLDRDNILIVTELIRLYLNHTQPLLDTLKHTSDDPSASTYRIALHRLKGSSASIGAVRLAQFCEELEQELSVGAFIISGDVFARMAREYECVKEALEHYTRTNLASPAS